VLVTVIFSLALLVGIFFRADLEYGHALAFLWTVYFAAFWIALRVACAIAWETSFKQDAWLKLQAKPIEVLISIALFCIPLIALHAFFLFPVLVKGSIGYFSVALFIWAIPTYVFAVIVGLICIYLPTLLITKMVGLLIPNPLK
jgi:hypothetical protein